jgi:hypothetical protein
MINCEVCQNSFLKITKTHLLTHGMAFDIYRQKFPLAILEDSSLNVKRISSAKKTCMEKYGVSNPSQVKEFQDKRRVKVSEKWQDPDSKYNSEEYQNSWKEMISDFQDKAVENRKESNLNKYGVESTLSVPEIQLKTRDGVFNKYGVDNVMKVREIAHECLSNGCERPNYAEKQILNLGFSEIEYTGDATFQVILNDGHVKYPDFVVKNSNKLIELFGEHFHSKDEEVKVIQQYKEVGHECLVIWSYELKDVLKLKNKIINYLQNPQRLNVEPLKQGEVIVHPH